MKDRSHGKAALDELRAIDTDSLPEDLVAAHEQAITNIETLVDGLEESTNDSGSSKHADTPDDWEDNEWEEQLDEAREKADLPPTKGTITTKTINDRDYYYLQWREGDKVKSQYVCPVDPT